MDIIVSHQLTDLDGLGAMVAASKLYPAARPVFVGRLHRSVKDFLVLYKDKINIASLDEIDLDQVERVIMVDTHKKELTGDLYEQLDWDRCKVVIYDHHPHEREEWVTLDMSEDLGSATTILVNRIVAEDLKLNSFEATICALAIYADTGNLTHLNTTASDTRALAYLLDAGANLKIINDFIKEPLSQKQEKLLARLIKNREDLYFDGIIISIFSIIYDEYVPGLNRVTEQIKRLYHLSSLFIIFVNGRSTQIIGRSSDEAVDMGKICTNLGGGGHSGAAAANLKEVELEEARRRLIREINKNVQPLLRVKEIMSSPVRTVSPDTSIKEIEELMKKYGHNGFIVLEENKVKGIFSRGDLRKVKGHNLMHAPVRAYMTKKIVTIEENAPISKAQRLMVENAIGRLPVMGGDRLVGIITRTDLLTAYHGGNPLYESKHRYGSSLVDVEKTQLDIREILEKLPGEMIRFLKKAGEIADKNGVRVYLIGGMVRDILLKKDNRDLDIVVDGSLENYIKELANIFNGQWTYNEKFRTGSIILATGLNIDLAVTRKEIYQYTGALPEVEASDIIEDLFRRDYTINALAVKLNSDEWGQLMDYFQGIKDLKDGRLRILHRFSFLDDPTRIIRGIRLAVKTGFSFTEETSNLLEEALTTADFSRLSVERVFKELELLFSNQITPLFFQLIRRYPIFRLLNLNIEVKEEDLEMAKKLEYYLAEFKEKNYNIEDWVLRIALFTDELIEEDLIKWNIRSEYKDILLAYSRHRVLLNELKQELAADEIVEKLKLLTNEEILILLVKCRTKRAEENILKYLVDLKEIKIDINGDDLREIGLQPGPVMREVLEKVYSKRLQGEIKTRKEQLAYAGSLIREVINEI